MEKRRPGRSAAKPPSQPSGDVHVNMESADTYASDGARGGADHGPDVGSRDRSPFTKVLKIAPRIQLKYSDSRSDAGFIYKARNLKDVLRLCVEFSQCFHYSWDNDLG